MRKTLDSIEWPEVIGDETGDLRRENICLWRSRNQWRSCALFLLATIVGFVAFVLLIEGLL